MRIETKGIFVVNYKPVKHLHPPPPKWASVFCGRQNTLAVSDKTTRQEVPSTAPRVLPHGAAAEHAAVHGEDSHLSYCQAETCSRCACGASGVMPPSLAAEYARGPLDEWIRSNNIHTYSFQAAERARASRMARRSRRIPQRGLTVSKGMLAGLPPNLLLRPAPLALSPFPLSSPSSLRSSPDLAGDLP